MRRACAALLVCGSLVLSNAVGFAAGPEPIPLWPNGAPGAKGNAEIDTPAVRIYPAAEANATGACVVVLPGGGYRHLAMDHEGQQIAAWFNSIGVTAAVVSYRLAPNYGHPSPMLDAQRGIRYVRANAEKLKIDPNRVGVMGFSAGGHLASTVSTLFDAGDSSSSDPIDRQSSRPDFSILCYPVISLKSSFTHGGSKKNLLGENPDPALVEKLSTETQITKDTPPTFIFHTAEDKAVPVQNAIVYFEALQKHGIASEMHIYQKGPHGVGLAPKDPVLSTWKERLADWLKINGFLSTTKRAAISGSVELDGEPLPRGTITFIPDDKNAPTAFAMVSRGKYSLDEKSGPAIGKNNLIVCSLGAGMLSPTVEKLEIWEAPKHPFVCQVASGRNVLDLQLTK